MVWKTRNPAKDGKVLSEALKAVRRHRGLLAQDVAKAMNMPLRTYQHFESGRARINLDHIVRFANATNSDPLAILVSVWTGSAPFARRTADNKAMLVFAIALQEFDEKMGDRTSLVHPWQFMAAFHQALATISTRSMEDSQRVEQWMNDTLNGKKS